MCSFIYGCALSKPILGVYFELPKKYPPKRNLIFDMEHRDITDVSFYLAFFLSSFFPSFFLFFIHSFLHFFHHFFHHFFLHSFLRFFLPFFILDFNFYQLNPHLFQVFAYRYMDTEKYVVKDIHIYKNLDELLSTIRAEQKLKNS